MNIISLIILKIKFFIAIENASPGEAYDVFDFSKQKNVIIPFEKRIRLLQIITKDYDYSYLTLCNWASIGLTNDERFLLIAVLTEEDFIEEFLTKITKTGISFTQREFILIISMIMKGNKFGIIKILLDNYALPKYLDDLLTSYGVSKSLIK